MASTDVVTVSPAPPGYEIDLVNPPYCGYKLAIVAIVFGALSTIIVGLRIYTRRFIVKSMGWDDLFSVVSLFWGVVFSIADCVQTKFGAGTHLWDITIPRFTTFLKIQILLGTSYISALTFAKIAICVFYLRLSPNRTFRIIVFCTIGFTLAYNLSGALVVIFSCNPVAASWDLALAALPTTKCVNRPADYLAQAGLNIFTDALIFVLPIYTIWNLQLPMRQRLSVIAIFATGLFVNIISIIRLKSVIHILGSTDLTWDTSDLLLWSTIECHVTIICACLATLKPFLKRYFPSLLGFTSANTSNNKRSPYPRDAYASITGSRLNGTGGDAAGNRMDKMGMYDVEGAEDMEDGGSGTGSGSGKEHQRQSYAMRSYRERMEGGKNEVVVQGGGGKGAWERERERRVGESGSQEYIIQGTEGGEDMERDREMGKKGVFVTKTVDFRMEEARR